MEKDFLVKKEQSDTLKLKNSIDEANNISAKFGLSLSNKQIEELIVERKESLKNNGRVEFGESIIKKLIYEFCDSPYIDQENYEYTLCELQESFYYFKNESNNLIPDDELIEFLKSAFDNDAGGSIEYLAGMSIYELCRNTRFKNYVW